MKKNNIHFIVAQIEDKNGKKYMTVCDYQILIDFDFIIRIDAYGEYDMIYPADKTLICFKNWVKIDQKEYPWNLFKTSLE